MLKIGHEQPISISHTPATYTFPYPCLTPFECSPYAISLQKGTYYLEVYGAGGGNSSQNNKNIQGGKGGYSAGVYQVNKISQTLYLYVGGTSNSIDKPSQRTFNGGGYGNNKNDGFGGGGTDFRTILGDDENALKSRIIVAGGGGGAYDGGNYYSQGGSGGGENGNIVTKSNYISPCYGTQNGCEGGSSSYSFCEGKLGVGGSGSHGGGGGGYFGGGCADVGGGGGSGYIGGVFATSQYPKTTNSDANIGSGWAKITVISEFGICTQTPKAHISLVFLIVFFFSQK